jgi:hypothetical protein
MPLKEGAEIDQTEQALKALKTRIDKAVEEVTGKRATDVAPVYYQQSWTAYIGLPGTSSHATTYNPTPSEKTELPQTLIKTYSDTMDANVHALQTGLPEDRQKYDKLREEAKEQAKDLTDQLMHVLAASSDVIQRRVAAHCLGLVAHTQEQINALSTASSDEDAGVRNDAVRALSVIAYDNPETAKLIPAAEFIKLLNSGTWTDRNKGGFVICALIKNRDRKLIEALRRQALPALKEIAGWDPGHAFPALKIIGVIANIPDDKLNQLIASGRHQEILDALKDH